jgi:DNA-binding response OmpR family regulator
MSKLRILIIEDQENWQNQLQVLVQRLGPVECDVANDTATAAHYINGRKYDLAIVDLLLATGGFEVTDDTAIDLKLLQAIRESQSNQFCAVIVLSGYGNSENTRKALLEYGAFDFIEKNSFKAARLIDTLGLALFQARQKVAVERAAKRYRFVVQMGHERLLGCELTGPGMRSSYSAANPPQIDIRDLARRTDNLNLLIENGSADIWRSEARSLGKATYEMLGQDQRILIDLRTAQALAKPTDDLWLEFSGPTTSLGAPFELLRDSDYLTFAHVMTRRLVLPNSTSLHNVQPFHVIVEKLLKEKQRIKVLVVGANSDGEIPTAETEAETVGDLIENQLKHYAADSEVTVLSGKQAEYKNVCDALAFGGYHIFHYAGHGEVDEALPESSGLVLREQGKLRMLTAATINMLVRNSSLALAYLSCCFGARSDSALGRGDFSGMLEAFAQADVPMVLGFRWSVGDDSALSIAETFHSSLWRCLSPGESLLNARRAAAISADGRDDDSWASPVLLMQNSDAIVR